MDTSLISTLLKPFTKIFIFIYNAFSYKNFEIRSIAGSYSFGTVTIKKVNDEYMLDMLPMTCKYANASKDTLLLSDIEVIFSFDKFYIKQNLFWSVGRADTWAEAEKNEQWLPINIPTGEGYLTFKFVNLKVHGKRRLFLFKRNLEKVLTTNEVNLSKAFVDSSIQRVHLKFKINGKLRNKRESLISKELIENNKKYYQDLLTSSSK